MAKGDIRNVEKPRRRTSVVSLPYIVFISHSSNDLWIANQIARELKALGVEVWLDEKDLKGGDILLEEIRTAIRACHEVIVLISQTSAKSQWVAVEIGMAVGQRKRVTPILNNVSPDKMIPMKGIKSIELNDFEKFLIQLRSRIGQRHRSKR